VKHIIVDNTNIRTWEYTNYIVAAKMHGYAVEIVEFRPITVDDIRVCIERNEHRVPADIVSRMCVEFEDCAYATVMPIVKE
jgi:predicted kinase